MAGIRELWALAEHCRSAQLVHLTGARHALLLGDGDGRFLACLLAAHATLTADVVDSSHSMLRILDRAFAGPGGKPASAFACITAMLSSGIQPEATI